MVSNAIPSVVRLFGFIVLTLFVLVGAVPVGAQAPTLAGTWRMIQGPGGENFHILMDFSEGGAARYTDQGFSSGIGVWTKTSGSNFAATFEEFVDFNNDRNADARLRFRATIQLAGASALVGTMTADVVSLDGSAVLQSFGNATFVGTRMAVILE